MGNAGTVTGAVAGVSQALSPGSWTPGPGLSAVGAVLLESEVLAGSWLAQLGCTAAFAGAWFWWQGAPRKENGSSQGGGQALLQRES